MTLLMLKSPTKPSKDDILANCQDWKMWHSRRLSQNKIDVSYWDMSFDVPSPEGREPLRLSSGRAAVTQVIQQVIAESPILTVLPRSQSESDIKLAGRRTVFANGFWHRAEILKILRKMLWHSCVRGCSVGRVIHDPTAWPLRPTPPLEPPEPADLATAPEPELLQYMDDLATYAQEKKLYDRDLADWAEYTEEHLPVRIDILDPMGCFWEPTEDPQRIVISSERTVAQIKRDCPKAIDALEGMDDSTLIEWNEYYDEWYCAFWIGGAGQVTVKGGPINRPHATNPTMDWVVEPTEHHFGFFPFIVDGPWEVPMADADKRYPSIYYPIRSVLQYESTLATMIANIIRVNGWAPLIMKSDRAEQEEQKPIIDMTPGKMNYVLESEDIKFLEMGQGTLGALEHLISFISDQIQEGSGLADVLKGQARGRSGYQQAQLASMARVALVPIEMTVRSFLEKATRFVFKLVRYMDEPLMFLGGSTFEDNEVSIAPKDTYRLGMIKAQLRTALPIDESAKIANYLNLNKAGWLSAVTGARLAGIENPEDEHSRWMAEQIAQQAPIMEAQAKLYIKEHWNELYQIMQEEQAQAAQMAQQAQQPPGPDGRFGPPGGAPTPMGGAPMPSTAPAGGAQQQQQVQRQAVQGGTPPRRLARGGGGGSGNAGGPPHKPMGSGIDLSTGA